MVLSLKNYEVFLKKKNQLFNAFFETSTFKLMDRRSLKMETVNEKVKTTKYYNVLLLQFFTLKEAK